MSPTSSNALAATVAVGWLPTVWLVAPVVTVAGYGAWRLRNADRVLAELVARWSGAATTRPAANPEATRHLTMILLGVASR